MPETDSRRLGTRRGKLSSTFTGWIPLLLSVPFLGTGSAGIHLRLIRLIDSSLMVLFVVIWVIGCALASWGGLWFLFRYRKKKNAGGDPDKPWLSDYKWDPKGMNDLSSVRKFWEYFIPGYRHRKSLYLKYERFPFFTGETLDLKLSTFGNMQSINTLDVTLRYIEERFEASDPHANNGRALVCYQLYADTARFSEITDRQQKNEIPVSFEIPNTPYTTRMNQIPPQYWELEVTGDSDEREIQSRFILPVYRKCRNPALEESEISDA